MPTLWSDGEGRSRRAGTTEAARGISRGSRGGMWRKRRRGSSGRPVAVAVQEPPTGAYKATAEIAPGRNGSRRGSESRSRARDNIIPPEGRDPTLFALRDRAEDAGIVPRHRQLRKRSGRYRGSSIARPSGSRAFDCRPDPSACRALKDIGKPCTGKPYARFDEAGRAPLPRPGS